MRLLFTVMLGTVLLSGPSFAQEENVTTATSALQTVLSTLKQNVEKLSFDNDQLATKDNAIKQQVSQLQMQLGQLEAQGDVLNKAADKLQDKNPGRAQQITRLEKENFDLDNRIQKAEGTIKLIQPALDAGYQEDQRLLLQLKSVQNGTPIPPMPMSPESQTAAHVQKEKLRLMKMIFDSQQRQEELHKSILELQKNTNLLPAPSALAHQQRLGNQWDDVQLHQLEGELKALEHNYAQLKDLMAQMSKKVQNTRMTVSQHVEGEKLQSSIDDLNRQGQGLRADLDDLRSQMVDLDKRKFRLETMIQQLH